MPYENRELFNAIEREFLQLRYRWGLFCQLFDSGQSNIDLLNKSGSNVFQLLQKLVIDDLMMSLCRLSDRNESMGHENASIRNMINRAKENLSNETNSKVQGLLSELDRHLKNISKLRNKALSHTDYEHALNPELLPRPTYDELENSVDVIRRILGALSSELYNYSTSYVPLMPLGHDGNKLLAVLTKAHGYQKNEG
ncbi:hypothetical protein [Sedimenticola selenatireducens]|uniref:AbiU2 domain-containing protein n=1 Tax=Sedimenticola selenatireducens TaxID=191960 RepID=UPI002AABDEA8|nr:hypothetical protein [Sedimenticola selenatireducens]